MLISVCCIDLSVFTRAGCINLAIFAYFILTLTFHLYRPANCYAFAVFVTLWRLIIRRYGFAANNTAESSGS